MNAALRRWRWIPESAFLLAVALALGAWGLGRSPAELYRRIFVDVLTNGYGIGQIFYKATTLIFTGLACALAFRCGLFNIGAEGQIYAGSFSMTLVGLALPGLPGFVLVPLMLAAAAAGGAAWAAVPAWLKSRHGAHEVITTMMMNFVAMATVNYLVTAHFHEPESIHTAEIPAQAQWATFESALGLFRDSPVNLSLFVAVGLCVAAAYFLWRTPEGFEWRAVGASAPAARAAGIPVDRSIVRILLASGAVAGLAGTNFILGYKHYFEQGFASGAGFLGIAVALVARNDPRGIVPAALLFAFLSQAGLTLNTMVPRELFEILQAAAILIIVVLQNRSVRSAR
jgi:simple sugar transport system permease protein